MSLSADALTTWARVKAVLQLSDSDHDTAELLIDAASLYANRRSGRKLKSRAVDLRLDGPRGRVIVLPESPVTVTQLWIDETRAFAVADVLAATDYQLDAEAGIIRLYETVSVPGGQLLGIVRVVGTAGYDPVPADLEQAVLECVSVNLRRLRSGSIGLKTISAEGAVSSSYEIDWPTTALAVFDSYRRPSI